MAVILHATGPLSYEDVRSALKGLRDDSLLEKTTRGYQGGDHARPAKVYNVEDDEYLEDDEDPIAQALLTLEGSEGGDLAEEDVIDEDEAYAVLAAWQAGPGGRGSWQETRRVVRDR